jgi:hypothetical protein
MGGLLGLGLGISFISVIEILYFFLVRHFFLRKRDAPDLAIQRQTTEMKICPSSLTFTSSIGTVTESNPDRCN